MPLPLVVPRVPVTPHRPARINNPELARRVQAGGLSEEILAQVFNIRLPRAEKREYLRLVCKVLFDEDPSSSDISDVEILVEIADTLFDSEFSTTVNKYARSERLAKKAETEVFSIINGPSTPESIQMHMLVTALHQFLLGNFDVQSVEYLLFVNGGVKNYLSSFFDTYVENETGKQKFDFNSVGFQQFLIKIENDENPLLLPEDYMRLIESFFEDTAARHRRLELVDSVARDVSVQGVPNIFVASENLFQILRGNYGMGPLKRVIDDEGVTDFLERLYTQDTAFEKGTFNKRLFSEFLLRVEAQALVRKIRSNKRNH